MTRRVDRALLLCFGNPAREDDGLGPALAERIEALSLETVRIESDYQLCVEDAIAVAESRLVVFVDASVSGSGPFLFAPVAPGRYEGLMSHSIEPEALLGLTRDTMGGCPESYLLAIRGYSFRMFTEGLTEHAARNLDRAVNFLGEFLRKRSDGSDVRTADLRPEVQAGTDEALGG